MFLTRIELQGFKSFAEKTIIELPKRGNAHNPLTAVVGPNGSGKSNIADAVRWVLGEQSTKAVRGGKSEDVIFFGSQKRNRASMAEVALLFDNSDGAMPVDRPEIKISRRLYRDGSSEYLLNNAVSRLGDIQLLLAKANFGKESYLVIAQGMIDHLILMGGAERKTFFDEATGVRHLQIKKEQAIKKLVTTEENLRQAKLLQDEIEPRLRSLTRQVKRLEEREEIEKELFELQKNYFSTAWNDLEIQRKKWQDQLDKLESALAEKNTTIKTAEEKMSGFEFEETKSDVLLRLQKDYQNLLEQKQLLREKEFKIKNQPAGGKKSSFVDYNKIFTELDLIYADYEKLILSLQKMEQPQEISTLKDAFEKNAKRIRTILDSLKQEPAKPEKVDDKQLIEIIQNIEAIDQKLKQVQTELSDFGRHDDTKKSSFLEVQRKMMRQQEERRELERQINEIKIEMAKIEVRSGTLQSEMSADLKEKATEATDNQPALSPLEASELLPKIEKLKRQLEWIGGIDPEVVKEYNEAKERYSFLETQSQDLEVSMKSLVDLANDLEGNIQTRFEESFNKINEKFSDYFKLLFNGGVAKLVKVIEEVKTAETSEEGTENTETPPEKESILDKLSNKKIYQGIEIQATPPGKKLKNVTLLSGGEKALTSTALLSAVLAINPPPFLVLDEVDAALDESNSLRFAKILNELSTHTQLIVITHNRATMQVANVLYGVSMSKEGISKMLSLKLEEGEGALAK